MKLWIPWFLFLSACSHRRAEQKYANYINEPENKIVQHITIGEVTMTAKWLPEDYRRLMNKAGSSGNSKKEGIDYCYFDIKFDKKTGDKPDKNKILYLDFDMQKDFVLMEDKDSIPPAICQKIENGISGSYEYILAFERQKKDENFGLIYNDKIFSIGTVAFVYNEANTKRIPVLKKENIQ